jgi:hypothetical protein
VAQGRIAMLCGLVKDGMLKAEEAAKRANLSVSDFLKK